MEIRYKERVARKAQFKMVYTFCGYYEKGNVSTFNSSGCTWGPLAARAELHGGWWDAKAPGEYYYLCGAYECKEIEEKLGKECSKIQKEVFFNLSPLMFDQMGIKVSEEIVDCEAQESRTLCYTNLATVLEDLPYCEKNRRRPNVFLFVCSREKPKTQNFARELLKDSGEISVFMMLLLDLVK